MEGSLELFIVWRVRWIQQDEAMLGGKNGGLRTF